MISGNKGEWSEIYVLFRLLAEGKIYAADGVLNKIDSLYIPIIKAIRKERTEEQIEYNTGEVVEIFINGEKKKSLPSSEFKLIADYLLKNLSDSNLKSSFPIKDVEDFMNKIFCHRISAPSTDKSDIVLQIHDINTGFKPIVGFSIKSELGSSPTLLNAGRTTNFIFKINKTSKSINLLNIINNLYKESRGRKQIDLKGRICKIIEEDCNFEYVGMENQTFKDNLVLIDSQMDCILAETLLYFYRDSITDCKDMVKKLEYENPMHYGNVNAYSYKFKKFLSAVALGMKPATTWDGIDEASGGYIIVTKEGGVLAYHIYNRNYFEDYLLNNTKYETASTTRHKFGELYEEDSEELIKLNLQVRFN